jgi:hypothetical protein
MNATGCRSHQISIYKWLVVAGKEECSDGLQNVHLLCCYHLIIHWLRVHCWKVNVFTLVCVNTSLLLLGFAGLLYWRQWPQGRTSSGRTSFAKPVTGCWLSFILSWLSMQFRLATQWNELLILLKKFWAPCLLTLLVCYVSILKSQSFFC